MLVSNIDIADLIKKKELTIKPFSRARLNKASYTLTLSDEFYIFDPSHKKLLKKLKGKSLYLEPNFHVFLKPREVVKLPPYLSALIISLPDSPLQITPTFLDYGSRDVLLPVTNISPVPLEIKPRQSFAEIRFVLLTSKVKK